MNLNQFAIAAAAEPKWLLNSSFILGRSLRLTPENARWWGLVRLLERTFGLTLAAAGSATTRALASANDEREVIVAGDIGGSATLVVDTLRFDATFLANLSRARVREIPRRRGRRAQTSRDPVGAAKAYGLDIGLLQASLNRTPSERLALLERNRSFVNEMQHSRVAR